MQKLFVLVFTALAIISHGQSSEIFQTQDGAIRGYDPVAYFKLNRPVKGSAEFKYELNGATWYFSSAENLEAFKATPDKYLPQFGGYCAYGASDGDGHKAPTQPDAWTISGGKLYFNYNKNVQSSWLKDTTSLIQKARTNWPKIKDQ